MISSDVHPPLDPCSSSDHHNQLKFHAFKITCDDKARASTSDIDLLKSLAADPNDNNNPQPSFSIRDYVFNSRGKDIACNWPFSHKSLHICLKRGVKNLLPPFQSLEKLRNNSSFDGKSDVQLILEPKTSEKSQTYLQEDLGQIKSKKVGVDSSRKTETAIKCRTVSVEPIKEVTPMAAKVCPVCKTFSSSSNTTLNAHIDRCLSGESSMKWPANPKVVVKHRIKPRKMRLMVDIYKTAPHCTVEELDARNGTSWANTSSFPSQELEFQGEEECRETTIVPEVLPDHIGDVYIDTDGTKVRILSVPKVDTPDDHGVRATLKGGKVGKSFIGKNKNKNHQVKPQHNYLEASPHSKKLKPFSEVRNGQEENVAIKESCNKEDQGKEAMSNDDLPIVRPPWACSKRTVLVKKSQHSRQNATKNLSIASDKTFAGCAPSSSANTTGVLLQQNNHKKGTFSTYKEHFAKKRSPLLTEPTSKHLKKKKKKKGTLSRNGCEDPSDLKSRGSKLPSSGKKLLPVSREPASKLNLKRKLSAIERPCVGPSDDSVTQKSQVEEQSRAKLASESTILFEVRKNEETKICGPENSVTSRSSNGDSSAWMKTDFVNPSCDVESYTKETRSHHKPVSTESPKMVSEPDNMFDSREGNVDKEMHCADVNKNLMRIDVADDIERQQNYFLKVDPMKLTEPPGLFLTSHDQDVVSAKLHGSSSMATLSRDMMDRDSMSDSPISTVSNPSLARSDSDKFAPITYGDWRSMHTTSFKNDHPCCCSRKELASTQTVASSIHESTLIKKHAIESFYFRPHMFSAAAAVVPESVQVASPSIKLPAYSECESVSSPSKPVLRLMGKNLTVVNTDDYENIPQLSPMGQFPNVQNEYNSPRIHAFDTMFRSTTYADHYRTPQVAPVVPQASASQDRRTGFDGHVISEMNVHNAAIKHVKEIIIIDDSPESGRNHTTFGYQSQRSLAYSNDSFQGYSAFMNVENDVNLAQWNCAPTGSSRSSSIYYPPI